jgi:hypothetical protein
MAVTLKVNVEGKKETIEPYGWKDIFGNILKFTPKMWSEGTLEPLTSTFPTGYLRPQ